MRRRSATTSSWRWSSGTGTPRASALALANGVLARAGGVRGLARTGWRRCSASRASAPRRQPACWRRSSSDAAAIVHQRDDRPRFDAPADLARFLVPQFGARPVEHFGALLLDGRNRLLRTAIVSIGTLDASVVQPRDIFREALIEVAAAVVLFHNHPSGDPTPSREDVLVTRRMVEAGVVMGIDVLDHLVLADASFYSFRDNGQL